MGANQTLVDALYRAVTDSVSAGRSPSVRELADSVGIRSTSTVHKYLKELEERGLIIRNAGEKRNIALPHANARMVPVLGTAAAGAPILAQQEYLGFVPYGGRVQGELFAVRIHGESMINAGILDGDVVVVKRTPAAEDGQIVLALIEDEATVKRFYREKDRFRLQPENDTMSPIYTETLQILGRVVACVRQYEEV